MAKNIKFTKMHGLGNDFIIVDYEEIKKNNLDYKELSIKMCDRNFGIGADGLIIVNPEDMKADTDASWRIFNSDGTEPQMCGNGIRCFAGYVYDRDIVNSKKFTINTLAGIITPEILENNEIKVDMGRPVLESSKIPTAGFDTDRVLNSEIQAGGQIFKINAVSMGNPHCIIFSDEDIALLALKYGSEIESSPYFPEKTNVEFVKVISRDNIKINVWERGCGITLACGTGACASAVAAILNNLTDNTVNADLPGGRLKIAWNGKESDHVFMTGTAEYVFSGEYLL